MNQPWHRGQKLWRWGRLLWLALAGVVWALAIVAALSVWDEVRLRQSGQVVRAQVTAWRAGTENGETVYDVRYSFRGADGAVYRCSDRTGRRDLWCRVNAAYWPAVNETRELTVVVVPEQPHINRPVHGTGSALLDAVAAFVLMAVTGSALLLGLWLTRSGASTPPLRPGQFQEPETPGDPG